MPRLTDEVLAQARGRSIAALALLAGTWRGELVYADGSVDRFTFLHDPPAVGEELGVLALSVPGSSPTPVRLLDANQHAFVVLAGPYVDPRLQQPVFTVFEGVRGASELSGHFYTRSIDDGSCIALGVFTARRGAPMHQAA